MNPRRDKDGGGFEAIITVEEFRSTSTSTLLFIYE